MVGWILFLSELGSYERVLSRGVVLPEFCFKRFVMAAVRNEGRNLDQ